MWQAGSAKASLNFGLLVLTCASASAADLAPVPPLPPVLWARESWTGFYIGAGGGFSSLNNKIDARPGPDPSSPLSATAWARMARWQRLALVMTINSRRTSWPVSSVISIFTA
jgi:hypothetical protein